LPIYVYRCERCGEETEVGSRCPTASAALPHCRCTKLKRVFHPVGIAVKGSGFDNTGRDQVGLELVHEGRFELGGDRRLRGSGFYSCLTGDTPLRVHTPYGLSRVTWPWAGSRDAAWRSTPVTAHHEVPAHVDQLPGEPVGVPGSSA
jgi:putative FmdB family regulatory protein